MVVAIGGSASVGKTSATAALSQALGLDLVVHVDDLSRRLQDPGGGQIARPPGPGFRRLRAQAILGGDHEDKDDGVGARAVGA